MIPLAVFPFIDKTASSSFTGSINIAGGSGEKVSGSTATTGDIAVTSQPVSDTTEVAGGRTGRFIEKPDIIDIFCRREIPKDQPELEEMIAMHFAKIYVLSC